MDVSTSYACEPATAWMASVGINIPLWRGKLRAAEAEAAIRLKASQDLRQDIQNDTSARIHELFTEVKMYEEQTELLNQRLSEWNAERQKMLGELLELERENKELKRKNGP